MKQTLQAELSSMALKLLIGIILTSVAVFSIIQLGQSFQIWVAHFENGRIIEASAFAITTVVCGGLLYYLFVRAPAKPVFEIRRLESPPAEVDLTVLAVRFAEGFMDGFQPRLIAIENVDNN